MHRATSYLAAGIAAALVLGLGPVPRRDVTVAPAGGPAMPATLVDRTRKGDRLPLAGVEEGVSPQSTVAAVEVGSPQEPTQEPTIVYRDGAGRVLFHADPANRTTAVSKGTIIPTMTIDHDRRPVNERPGPPAEPTKLKIGCEPASSPLAAPAGTHLVGRCLASAVDLKFLPDSRQTP
jgi:hypothetical protein